MSSLKQCTTVLTSTNTSLFKLYKNLTSSQLKYSRTPLTQNIPLTLTKSNFPLNFTPFLQSFIINKLELNKLELSLTQTNFAFPHLKFAP